MISDLQNFTNMSILIEKIRIKNFRSLKDVEVNLSPTTVLIGANNSGKTTFLKALHLAFKGDNRSVSQEDLFINGKGEPLPKAERIITIDIKIIPTKNNEFDDLWSGVFGDLIKNSSGSDFFAFRTRIAFTTSEIKFERFVIADWEIEPNDKDPKITSTILKSFAFYTTEAQRDLNEDLNYKKSYFGELVGKIEYKEEDITGLEENLKEINRKAVEESDVLKHTKKSLEELNHALQTNGTGVEITPFPKKVRDLHKGIKVHFQDGGSDSFSMEYHGMGTRSWASLLALKAKISWDKQIADSKEGKAQDAFFSILALEEPEAHLHPNAQRQVYQQLTSIEGQKFVSTHSPYIAGVAELAELRSFSKEGDCVKVTQLDISIDTKKLEKIRNEIIRSRGELLFAKILVFVEGDTETNGFPIFAKKYWGCNDFEKGIYFVPCRGTDVTALFNFVKALGIKWGLFSDYDKERVKKDINTSLKNIFGINDVEAVPNVILLKDNIESYLYEEGYESELKNALKKIREPEYKSEQHKQNKLKEVEKENNTIENYSKDELIKGLEDWKGKASKIYCNAIANLPDEERQIPTKIKELFEAIDQTLNSQNQTEDETATI